MKKIIFLIVLSLLIIFACEKSELNNIDSLLVVEGYLYQDEKVDSIHLMKSLPYESEDTVYFPIDDASISVIWNDQHYSLDNIGNGYYSYPGNDLSIEEGSNYSLEIKYKGQIITSQTTVPGKTSVNLLTENTIFVDTTFTFGPPQFEGEEEGSLEITWENPDNKYNFIIIESADTTAGDIIMGNSDFPDFPDFQGNRPGQMFRFRSEPFIGNSYMINSRMLEKYGEHKIKIYSVNQEYANLYENRTQDSRAFSEPVTNVVNGLGIFTAFSYTEVMFNVKNSISK